MRAWPENLERVIAATRTWAQRHWQQLLRLRQQLRLSEQTFHLVLAALVGILGGLVNLTFYLASEGLKQLLLRQQGDLILIALDLSAWELLAVPMLGGLVAGLCLAWGLRRIGPQGSGNLLEVVVAGNGRLPFRTGLIRALSSLVSISTGASIGREGPITQFSATLASKLGQWARWPPYRLRMLVACGAASGMAAAYNAPIGGAVFAAQIVLGNFSMNLFAPLLCASVVAAMVSRSVFGIEAWYDVPANVEFTRLSQLPWFVVLGLLAGALGAAFLKLLRSGESLFARFAVTLPWRMALGGLLVGAISIGFPGVWGNGYGATNEILHGRLALDQLGGLFVAKLLAVLITVGSGAVGGVFTPTLFLGAGLGALFGETLHLAGLAPALPLGAFALVGMGGVLAATTHSPLLAIIIVFEISLDHTLMPPLVVACAISTLVSRRFYAQSVYTEPLRQRGLEIEAESAQPGAAIQQTVGDLMREPIPPLRQATRFREIANRFLTSPNNFLPVVDDEQRLVGVVALQDLKEYLSAGPELESVIAFDVMRPPPPCLSPRQKLVDALPVVLASEQRNIPVVNTLKERRLIGTLIRAEALGLLSEFIAPRSQPHEQGVK